MPFCCRFSARTALILVVFAACAAELKAQTARALLVGIGRYQPPATETGPSPQDAAVAGLVAGRDTWDNLEGPSNDVEAMRSILLTRYGFKEENIRMLLDAAATRENILAEFRSHLIDSTAAGDIAFFYYAGHGSQVVNSRSTETDKKDETLVPADAYKGTEDIRDKELRRLYNELLDKGAILTIIFDSCHSGSIARGMRRPGKARYLPPDPRDVADAADPGPSPEDRGALVISAALDHQKAFEWRYGDVAHGIFTRALVATLRNAPVVAPAERVFSQTRALMQTSMSGQEPVLAGTPARRQRSLFGQQSGTLSGRTTAAVGNVAAYGLELQGGLAAGLRVNCELKKAGGGEPVRLRVSRVIGLSSSVAQVIEGNRDSVRTGDLFEVDRWVAPDEASLKVWMPPATLDREAVRSAAREMYRLRASERIHWVGDPTRESPTHTMSWTGSSWQLSGPDGRVEDLGQKPGAEEVLERLGRVAAEKPRLFASLPPARELAAGLEIGAGTAHDAIEVVAAAEEAHYFLVGRVQADTVHYAWVMPNAVEEDEGLALPIRSDWVSGKRRGDVEHATARQLGEYALRLGRIRDWLTLEPPPDQGNFPYELAFKNVRTGEIKSSGTLVKGESYIVVLRADEEKLERSVQKRFVYVFSIDSYGERGLFVPPGANRGNAGNHVPYGRPGDEGYPPHQIEFPNSEFYIIEPLGIDTYVLLTSSEAIQNLNIFEVEGVRTRARAHPLERLLAGVGAPTRGPRRRLVTPATWYIERLSLRSAAEDQ